MKKILLVGLALLFIISGCKKEPIEFEADELFSYNLLEDDTYEVFGNDTDLYKTSVTEVVVPSTYEGKAVTTIGYKAFSGYTELNSITIPEGIKYINAESFWNCSSLMSVELPGTLEWIFVDVFWGCTNLESILVSEDNVSYSSLDGIMYNKQKTSIINCPEGKDLGTFYVPETVELIDINAFTGCRYLEEIYVGPSVINIVVNDFWGCWECRGLSTVGDHAFWEASSLVAINVDPGNQSYMSVDGILYSKDMRELLICPAGKTGEVIIPEGVAMLGMGAFSSCKNITALIFPSTLTHLTPNALWGCDSLSNITVDSENEMLSYSDGIIYGDAGAKLILCFEDKAGDFVIPSTVTYISSYAFFEKNQLTSIYIPESVEVVEEWAFSICDSLVINVYHEARPETWYEGWNPDNITVVWNYR